MSLTKYLLHYKLTLIDNIMKMCQREYWFYTSLMDLKKKKL